MKIYVVFGQSGEYSHHRNWPAKGFISRERAEVFEIACTNAVMAYGSEYDRRIEHVRSIAEALRSRVDNVYSTSEWVEVNGALNIWIESTVPVAVPGDPQFHPDGGTADYYTLEVELEE